jgi:glycolate oxidase FAD binding subunit
MARDGLRATLEGLVGAEHVVTGPGVARYAVDGKVPELAVRPGTQAETANVLAACAAADAAVTPWGGGADRGLGNLPRRIETIVHLDRLNRVVEFDAPNLQVTAEAGITLGALEAVLADERQVLPWDPPADHMHTLGGLVATNRSGSSRMLYGTVRDWVLGMRVALPNGDLIRSGGKVIKNVSGYDTNKLFIGSLGTLGIVTEVSLKLLPVPPVRSAVVGVFPDNAAAARVVASVLESFLLPEALDLLNPEALRLVAPRIGVEVAAGAWGLAVAVAGSRETVERQSRDFAQCFGEEGGRATPIPGGRAETARQAVRNVFDLLPAPAAARLVCKIAVPIGRTADLALAAEGLAERHGLMLASLAHAGSGVVWAVFLIGPGAPPAEVLADLVTSLRREAEGVGGSLVLYGAPPALKARVDAWGDPGDGFDVMRRLKAEFDPGAICNPGRFLGGI